jgi:hypothetical protein
MYLVGLIHVGIIWRSQKINLDRFQKYLSLFADLDGMLKVDKVSTTFNNFQQLSTTFNNFQQLSTTFNIQRLCFNKETLNFPN